MSISDRIKQKANDIRTKIYGQEVRESLASGLEEMSEEVQDTIGRQDHVESQFQDVIDETTGKDVIAAPEIIAARNGEPNLKARLDKNQSDVTSQLAQTINEARRKRGLEDLTPEVLAAIQGGEGTSFNLLSIPQDYSVSPIKLTNDVKKDIGNATLEQPLFLGEIITQKGQEVDLSYNNEKLIISSSDWGGGMPTFDKSGHEEVEFFIGDSVGTSAFLPIIAIEEDAIYNSYPVTKYLAIRDINNNFVLKESFVRNSTSVEVINRDLITVPNTEDLHFNTGNKVNITNVEGIVTVYINSVRVLQLDISGYEDYSKRFGVWAAGYTGHSSKTVISNVVFSHSNIVELKKRVKVLEESEQPVQPILETRQSKVAHFSFDDVILAFKDITDNANSYSSVFQNEFFGYLKSVHEAYGTTFSNYVFYTDSTAGDFTLSGCTDKFASEFTANADWLKFGFHSRDGSTNYSATTATKAKDDYNLVIGQLFRITGSLDCIDRLPRLQNYQGNLESLIAMRDAQCGILGALSSPDVRANYYLSEVQNSYLHGHDKMYDANNYLTFFKTSTISIDWNTMNTLAGANERDFAITFLHENQLTDGMKGYIERFSSWAVANDYVFGFPMDYAL